MRKKSMMGSSRFEFQPEMLEKRNRERMEILDRASSQAWEAIEKTIEEHADGDIVTREGLREYLSKRIVERFIEMR